MGFMSKFKPQKSSQAKSMKQLPVSQSDAASLPFSSVGSVSQEATGFQDPNDVPTYFTAFMVLYYGFFGITLLICPTVWAADGPLPFPNPMAYFTTISDEQAFGFRLAGASFLSLAIGPWLDEIFGGAGVRMMAFTRQMCILNTIQVPLFLYFAYYAPLATAVPFMWNIQAITCGIIFAWNVIEVAASALPTFYTLFTVGMFGFFSVALISAPDLMFGPPSPIAYWNTWSELGLMCGRSLGLGMAVLFILGYLYCGKTAGYAKLCTVWNITLLGFCAIPAYFGGSSAVASMWEIQFVAQIPFVVIGLYLELWGITGSWPLTIKCPAWGLNKSTYIFVNLLFFLPFVAAFCSDANMVFGPSSPFNPFPMFNTDLDETAIWFGRTWAVNVLLLCLGPYFFGMPEVKAVKLLTVSYLSYIGLFTYALLNYSVLNLIVIAPLLSLNAIFFFVGLYLSLPAQAGEDWLYMA